MTMTLKILLPSEVFVDEGGITRIVAETHQGSFGLLPGRLDCVAALTPGILTYQAAHGEISVAVDAGVLVKAGRAVLVSVRRAVGGSDLSKLREAVEQQFLTLGVQEKSVRSALAKMEGDLLRRLAEFERQNGR